MKNELGKSDATGIVNRKKPHVPKADDQVFTGPPEGKN
jgi:hypothetical protein